MITENFLERTNCIRPATGETFLRTGLTIFMDKKLTRSAEKVYDVLLDMCTAGNNIIRISINNLTKKVPCCRKSITNALNRLEECGYIDRLPKAWRTETNTFKVFKILPDKKRSKSKSKSGEQPDSMPAIQSKPRKARKPQAEKPEKKKYGKYNRVRLTDEEYNSLVNDFGQVTVETYIQRADDYSQEHKRYYNNNAVTIRKWIEEDRDKPNHGHNYRSKEKNKNNQLTDEELAGYMRLVNRFPEDYDIPTSEPEPKPEPEPISEPEEYQLTDEEISCVLRYDCYMIRDNQSHPLHNCTVLELLEIAKRQQKQRNTS